jgi:hypothetical protein
MPANCSLLLEVFTPLNIYDDSMPEVDWEVSSDPAHPTPYLIAPRNYDQQEIDPIRCTAIIGTVEVGVIDPPTVLGFQNTGWMTARIHDLLGRRCRLSRYINSSLGWTVIADGPAGPPKMDASYSAYRWTIRDTRESERKLSAFVVGGVTGIVPRGPLYGFGSYVDDTGNHKLLSRVLDHPVAGKYQISIAGDYKIGVINFAEHFESAGPGPATLHEAALIMDDAAQAAIQISEIATDIWGARYADVLWRLVGDTDWNTARPTSPTSFREPFVGTTDALLEGVGDLLTAANFVVVYTSKHIPEGFPTDTELDVEAIIRYRGPATNDFPYYVEGPLGTVLKNIYRGVYTVAPTTEITGVIYDPAGLDSHGVGFISRIQIDAIAFALMIEQVCARFTAPEPDVRAWAEAALYAPSGWIPALNNNMEISPISRATPDSVSALSVLDASVTVPAPNWQTGLRTVSQIIFNYPRYFIPTDPTIAVDPDGLATRDVTIDFQDGESALRYGEQIEEYDTSAFAAIGTPEGINIPGQLEQASLLAQLARFDVLDRYRAGVQSVSLSAHRNRIPVARVGDWVPWSLMHLPDRFTGLRGSDVEAAQIIAIRDDDCTWRTLILEESPLSGGPPGKIVLLEKVGDEPTAGGLSLIAISDVESY